MLVCGLTNNRYISLNFTQFRTVLGFKIHLFALSARGGCVVLELADKVPGSKAAE